MKTFFQRLESLRLSLGWGFVQLHFDVRAGRHETKEQKDAIGFFVSGEEEDED